MAHEVFISHSSKDAGVAQRVLAALEARGIRCWIAPRNITAGKEWEPSIMEALRAARAVVLVFSGAADASAHVRREVAAAADAGVPVLPFRIDRTAMGPALSYYLQGVHQLDAADRWEARLDELAATVGTLLEREAPVTAPAAPTRGVNKAALIGSMVAIFGGLVAVFAATSATRGGGDDAPARTAASAPMKAATPARPAAPPPVDPSEAAPEAVVRGLYTRGRGLDGLPPSLLTASLREAERNRADDEVRPDWRYDGADSPPAFEELSFETQATGPRTAETRVRWGAFPGRSEVVWTLCRLDDGRWRIADVEGGGRSLRRLDGLPPPDPLNGC